MTRKTDLIIYRNRDVVFDHLLVPERLSRWLEDLASATPFAELRIGGAYVQSFGKRGAPQEMRGRVIDLHPGERFAYELTGRISRVQVTIQLSNHLDSVATRVVATEEVTLLKPAGKLWSLISTSHGSTRFAELLPRLKTFLDHGGDTD